MDECAFEVGLECDVQCVRCKRTRPFPEDGSLLMEVNSLEEDGSSSDFVVETQAPCDWNCQETKVRVEITFGF